MAGYKETPRQKMIAMMYLVLTALLALNVSREMLNAFIVVNKSMEDTKEKFFGKIEATYAAFEQQNTINRAKVEPYWNKAMKAQNLTDQFVRYIDSIKYEIIARTEGITIEEAKTTPLTDIQRKDNYQVPTNFFIGSTEKKGEAFTIKNKIDAFREALLKIIDENDRDIFDAKLSLRTDGEYKNADGKPESWEMNHFFHTILAANVTILNQLILDAKNAELDVVNHLYSGISATDFKFNEIQAKVIPNSNYIFQGDEYRAEILVAAYDTTQTPEIYILDGADVLTEDNIPRARKIEGSTVILPASGEGTRKYAGVVRVKNPFGDVNNYHFSHSFLVAKPSATISPTKMNVFYRGVENPVSISASGKSDAQLDAQITAGKIVRTDKGWMVRDLPETAGVTTVRVYADDLGKKRLMGEQLFRIKMLPNPVAKIIGEADDKVTKQRMLANAYLISELPETDFEYDFKVISFNMIIPEAGGLVFQEKSEDQFFNQRMKDKIQNLRRGDMVIFSDIRVRGPEGPRNIGSKTIKID